MLFDLHVHTRLSPCSQLSLDEIIAHASHRGLDGVCITDHHSFQARKQLRHKRIPDGLHIFVGMEYSTTDGDFLIFGPLDHMEPGLSARQLLRDVTIRGGAAVAAHPFRRNAPIANFVIQEKLCHIVESINGRNSQDENQQLDQWRQVHRLVECAGSDAHSLAELGKSKTRFKIPIQSSADLVYALNNGLCAPYTGRYSA